MKLVFCSLLVILTQQSFCQISTDSTRTRRKFDEYIDYLADSSDTSNPFSECEIPSSFFWPLLYPESDLFIVAANMPLICRADSIVVEKKETQYIQKVIDGQKNTYFFGFDFVLMELNIRACDGLVDCQTILKYKKRWKKLIVWTNDAYHLGKYKIHLGSKKDFTGNVYYKRVNNSTIYYCKNPELIKIFKE